MTKLTPMASKLRMLNSSYAYSIAFYMKKRPQAQ